MFRTQISSLSTKAAIGSRQLHASPVARKTVTEKVSEVADKVNKRVGKTLASAIDKGEKAGGAVKGTVETKTEETKGKAEEAEGVLKHKANQAAAGAHKVKDEVRK